MDTSMPPPPVPPPTVNIPMSDKYPARKFILLSYRNNLGHFLQFSVIIDACVLVRMAANSGKEAY
jgi:hypothetical protein